MWRNQREGEWYLPISVVADQLRCHLHEVCQLAEKGIISFIRMPGSKIMISEVSVRHFMSQADQELC